MSQYVVDFLNAIYPLSEPLKQALHAKLKQHTYFKTDIIERAGRVSDRIYFIKRGLIRAYTDWNDKRPTAWFMQENDVAISIKSFLKRTVSDEYIEALEKTEVYYITHDELQGLYATYPEFVVLGLLITNHYHARNAEVIKLKDREPKDRYLFFQHEYPGLVTRLPANMIASYLNITPETLSRLKKRYPDIHKTQQAPALNNLTRLVS